MADKDVVVDPLAKGETNDPRTTMTKHFMVDKGVSSDVVQ